MEKSEYYGSEKKDDDNKADGDKTGGRTSSDSTPARNSKLSRRKETAQRAGKTNLKVDK